MKLIWVTDPHLNFLTPDKVKEFILRVNEEEADCVVITGDIAEATSLPSILKLLRDTLTCSLYFVCGNHDYYKGSIASIRENLSLSAPQQYLPDMGVVSLTSTTALIGHDGWADGGYADWFSSNVMLNDYFLIDELNVNLNSRTTVWSRMQELSKASADFVYEKGTEALRDHDLLVVATHVPPFRENAKYRGKISDANWLPHFSSKKMGDALLKLASEHSSKNIKVFCGHSHGEARFEATPNLICTTGEAKYGSPAIAGGLYDIM